MLESSTPSPIPPPPGAPPANAVVPSAPALAQTLGRARLRLQAIRLRTAGLGALAALLAVWPGLLALASDQPWAARAALLWPVVCLAGFVVAGPLWLWRRARSDEEMAQVLARNAPELRSALLSAVQLEGELSRPSPGFSRELARAHIDATALRASRIDLGYVFPGKPVRWASLASGVGALVALAVIIAAPKAFLGGLARMVAGPEAANSIAERLAEPITYDIELTYKYPAYTGLPPKVVPGTTGEISAPAGTEVALKTRADRDVAAAALVVGDQVRPLTVGGTRDLSGALIVQKPGSYRFRFMDAKGHAVAEGPPIPIAVEADAPPKVSLYSPSPEVEVDPRGEVTLRYDAQDDYGLQSVDLVYRVGGAKVEQRIALSHGPGAPKHQGGDYRWQLSGLSLGAGDRVTYRIEARDTDTVNGPKIGKTREQVLKVYSEAEHHRLALQRVEKLWEQMITQLGDQLDAPDRAAPAQYAPPKSDKRGPQAWLEAASEGSRIDHGAVQLVEDLSDAARELRKDRSAPKELPRALTNISGTLRTTTVSVMDARNALMRWSHTGAPDSTAARRLKITAENQISELEKDTIYLEKLLDHRRIEDLMALARDLAAKRRDLQGLMEKYQKAPDEQTKQAIQAEIARLKARIGELMERMSELARNISDEHLNEDARSQMAKSESMMGKLDKVQQLLNEGKVDEAMKELQKLGDQMDQLQNGLNQARGGFDSRQDPELAKQFGQFNDQLAQTAKAQRALEREARQLKQQSQADLNKALQEKGPDFAKKLRQKVAQARQKLDAAGNSPEAMRPGDTGGQVQESLQQLDHALAAEDYDAASEEAARAMALAQDMAGDLKAEAQRARRFPAFASGDPQKLDQAAEQANQGLQPLQDVKKELDNLFPRASQSMTPEQRQRLSQLQKKQQELEQQAGQLQQQMEQIGKKAPIFSPKMRGQMQTAKQQMGQAEGSMSERDPNGATSHAGEAASRLEQVQQGVKEAMKGKGQGGGGGLMLPSPDGEGEEDQQDEGGDGREASNERVEIPGQDKQDGPEEYRKDIMDAMKQGAPARYKEQVKKYYEEIVK